MAVAAEQQTEWQIAQEAHPELERIANQRLQAFLGATAVRGMAELQEIEAQDSLHDAIHNAREGDLIARQFIYNNVATDVAERLFKAGHQTKVAMKMVDGKLFQEGRRLANMHRNTLEHTVLIPEMLHKAKLELKNVLLFEELHDAGVLATHDAVVFSPSSTKMTLQQKKDYNFFLDTETCSVQLLSANGDEVTFETAFVAGKATPSSDRHDIDAIQTLFKQHGVKVASDDASELVQYVLLVPKSELPHGISDVVKRYDIAAGGTFYGEAKAQQDYDTYHLVCEERSRDFEIMVQQITYQLIAEADAFDTPLEAIERLDYLSDRLCVRYAISRQEVNSRIFGVDASRHIEFARIALANGEHDTAEQFMRKAQSLSNSGSCPLFKGQGSANNNEGSAESKGKKWMTCPHCSAKVFDDPCAKVLKCWDCRAKVVNGRVESKGNGGSRVRKAAAVRRALAEKHKLTVV